MKSISFLFLLSVLLTACTSSRPATGDSSGTSNKEMTLNDNEVSQEFALETYLQRTPGVTVIGSGQNARVQVRGVNSFDGNTQPLFIINGSDIGNSYSSAASMLRGMRIKSVRVLKDSDASIYGVRGAGGVIVVKAE